MADNNEIKQFPKEINDIGTIGQYQTGKNTFVGINLNLEMLYITTVTGSGFTHPQYAAKNDIAETIKAYYGKFSKNKYAQEFNKLSQKYAWNAYMTFPPQLVSEVLSYQQVLAPSKVVKGDSEFAALKIQPDLRRFYDQTDSKRFFTENLSKYNEMTANFAERYRFDYASELETFFGIKMVNAKFIILLSPLYSGGSTVAVENPDEPMTFTCIINPLLDDITVTNIIIHENAHHFLRLALNPKNDLIKQYQKYLEASFGKAQDFDKNDPVNFLYEFLARAVTILTLDQYHSPDMAYESWVNEKMAGWDHLDDVCALIKNKYLAERDKYPKFTDFLPVILEYFKAKSMGQTFDIGPKILEREEIKKAILHNAYWEGDPRIADLKAKKPYSILLAVELSPLRNPYSLNIIGSTGELISQFFDKAAEQFELTADGKPKVTASVYEGNIYKVNGASVWGFWADIPDTEFGKLEPGVAYKLTPEKQNLDYPWLIDENVSLIIPDWKKNNQ